MNLHYFLADHNLYKLHNVLIRLEVILRAILGRPIIYRVKLNNEIELSKDNPSVLIANVSIDLNK